MRLLVTTRPQANEADLDDGGLGARRHCCNSVGLRYRPVCLSAVNCVQNAIGTDKPIRRAPERISASTEVNHHFVLTTSKREFGMTAFDSIHLARRQALVAFAMAVPAFAAEKSTPTRAKELPT
ncbi:MAG: hypothetical protein E5V59_08765 [Mesorhizobium sp.]|nr:MAG: hypothetical protein E5V59_08765 [Mesorhizobium sp.]